MDNLDLSKSDPNLKASDNQFRPTARRTLGDIYAFIIQRNTNNASPDRCKDSNKLERNEPAFTKC
jgi:hypothetical protein